jgi:hypothetical protein
LQRLETWFQNHRPHNKGGKAKSKKADHSLLRNWTVRKVVAHTMKDQIVARVSATDKDAFPGSKEFIATYQEACTALIAGFTPAQHAECEQLVDQWNSVGPDPTTQAL